MHLIVRLHPLRLEARRERPPVLGHDLEDRHGGDVLFAQPAARVLALLLGTGALGEACKDVGLDAPVDAQAMRDKRFDRRVLQRALHDEHEI